MLYAWITSLDRKTYVDDTRGNNAFRIVCYIQLFSHIGYKFKLDFKVSETILVTAFVLK